MTQLKCLDQVKKRIILIIVMVALGFELEPRSFRGLGAKTGNRNPDARRVFIREDSRDGSSHTYVGGFSSFFILHPCPLTNFVFNTITHIVFQSSPDLVLKEDLFDKFANMPHFFGLTLGNDPMTCQALFGTTYPL